MSLGRSPFFGAAPLTFRTSAAAIIVARVKRAPTRPERASGASLVIFQDVQYWTQQRLYGATKGSLSARSAMANTTGARPSPAESC